MLKWLRQYSKWIMVVGGSLLMLVFLLPGADWLQPKARDIKIGKVGDRVIRRHDLNTAGSELDTVLAVYRGGGTGFEALEPVACNDNGIGGYRTGSLASMGSPG